MEGEGGRGEKEYFSPVRWSIGIMEFGHVL